MSALFFRPVVAHPVRCSGPAFFTRPTYPSVHDVAPLLSLFDESFAQLEQAQREARRHFKRPFNPKFDVKESQGTYTIEGELPGFDAKDINIEFLDDGHTLQIKGKTVKETRQQQAVEAAQNESPKAVTAGQTSTTPAEQPTSEAGSVKSHQATVEDEADESAEQAANASAASQQAQTQDQTVAEASAQPSQQSPENPDTKHWISERYTGSFTRSFQFPSKVDQEAVKASLKDGILAITLPFARKPESRKIQIE